MLTFSSKTLFLFKRSYFSLMRFSASCFCSLLPAKYSSARALCFFSSSLCYWLIWLTISLSLLSFYLSCSLVFLISYYSLLLRCCIVYSYCWWFCSRSMICLWSNYSGVIFPCVWIDLFDPPGMFVYYTRGLRGCDFCANEFFMLKLLGGLFLLNLVTDTFLSFTLCIFNYILNQNLPNS